MAKADEVPSDPADAEPPLDARQQSQPAVMLQQPDAMPQQLPDRLQQLSAQLRQLLGRLPLLLATAEPPPEWESQDSKNSRQLRSEF